MPMTSDILKPYTVTAHHVVNHHTPNRMHADGLPQKLGFRGSLVLGTAIYGNMTSGLVRHFGEEWLGRAVISVQLMKIVCEGDRLRIETVAVPGREQDQAFRITAYNETMQDEICARMETSSPLVLPDIDPLSDLQPNEWAGEVTQDRTWDRVEVGKTYRSHRLTLSAADNDNWKRSMDDNPVIYDQGPTPPLYPAHVLRLAPIGSRNQYLGDNAVHASSKAVVRRLLRVGDDVDLLTVPAAKWEKKGNHWVTLYCAARRRGEICAEIYHTQIFKLRGS